MNIEILLKVYFSENVKTDLNLRHIVADTLEKRGLAKVIEEGTGEGYFNLYLEVNQLRLEYCKKEIIDLIKSIGFLNYEFI